MRIEYVPRCWEASLTRDLTDAALDADTLLSAYPVREPAFYKGQWSKPGWYWMASLGHHVSYESKFERSLLMEADFEGTVTHLVPQPFRLHFERDAAPYRHVPDFLVGHTDGLPELVDVKGARARAKPLNRLTFTLTERACQELGFAFTVYTEPDRVRQQNLAFIAGYRGPTLAPLDGRLPLLVNLVAKGPMPFAAACQGLVEQGLPAGVAPAVVWRAAWQRVINVPMDTRPLGLQSLIDLPPVGPSGVDKGRQLGGAA